MSTKILSTNAIRGAIESNYCLELFIILCRQRYNLVVGTVGMQIVDVGTVNLILTQYLFGNVGGIDCQTVIELL